MGSGFTRRRFLKALGAAGACLALKSAGGCELLGRAQKLGSLRVPRHAPLRAPMVWSLPGVSPVLPKGVWAFRSRPDLAPAAAEVTGSAYGTAPGYAFLALKEGAGCVRYGPRLRLPRLEGGRRGARAHDPRRPRPACVVREVH
jgi:hypothetical protein